MAMIKIAKKTKTERYIHIPILLPYQLTACGIPVAWSGGANSARISAYPNFSA